VNRGGNIGNHYQCSLVWPKRQGEVARVINHLYGEKPKKDSELPQKLEEEVGDVLYNLACLANREGFDLDQALQKSINKVTERDKNRF